MENNNYNYNRNNYYYREKPKDENFYGGSRSSRSHNNNNKRFSNGRQQQSALSLEKQFCAAVGGVSWEKVLDTQKYMYQEEKVIQWKDSAVQEAFWNAKKRFLAQMYGQPCDIKLPDPDVFIDKIDWDSNIDQELLSDLDKRDQEIPSETEKDSGVVVGIPVVPEQFALTPMGWGDAEDQGENSGWCDSNAYHDNGVNNAEKVCSNNGWNDDYVYVTHDMVNYGDNNPYPYPYGGSKWNGGQKNKWWNHGGYNKKRSKWWNNGGWNPSAENFSGCRSNGNSYGHSYYNGNSYGHSHHHGYGSNNRGNVSSDIQWKPKPVSSRQW